MPYQDGKYVAKPKCGKLCPSCGNSSGWCKEEKDHGGNHYCGAEGHGWA